MEGFAGGIGQTYAVDQIKNDSHRDAKLFKVQHAIIVNVGQIPDPLELVITQLAVFKDRGGLGAVQMCPAICERGEDLPVLLDFCLLNSLVGHGL